MHLNTHSRFSLRYGVLSVDDILSWAQANGVTRMALTDVGTTSANWDFVGGRRGLIGARARHRCPKRPRKAVRGLGPAAAGYEALCRWFLN